jgi:hypothetical protein
MATQLFALFLGLAITFVGGMYGALARRMRHFRSVKGRVVARDVVVGPTGDTTEGRWGEGGGYTPQVSYRYVVDGVEHESSKIAFAVRGYKRVVAARKLAEIPDEVVVWYDPNKPGEAYLHKHGPALGCVISAVGAALVLGALLSLVS